MKTSSQPNLKGGEKMSEEKRLGRYISESKSLQMILQVGRNMMVDNHLVILPEITAQFSDGIYTTTDPNVIALMDKSVARGVNFFKDETAEERMVAKEVQKEIGQEWAKDTEEKIAQSMPRVITEISTSVNRIAPSDTQIKSTTCLIPGCGFESKSRFGLMSHMKKHAKVPVKMS